jgi:TorA maturation chaperone TorD
MPTPDTGADAGRAKNVNKDAGLEEAIRTAGGIGALARGLGIAQPSVSTWRRVPAGRVLAVEGLTGVVRTFLRPDLYPTEPEQAVAEQVDEIDAARAQEYALLAALLLGAPDAAMLGRLARLHGTPTPLGLAHIALAEAATGGSAEAINREYFDLFIGIARGELVPYASYYLTGFLNDRPLARLRSDMQRLGLQRAEGHSDPEDHIGTLCEIMSGFAARTFEASDKAQRRFFAQHLAPWAPRFFADLESAKAARFYRTVGTIGRVFMEIDADAYAFEGR